MMNLGTKILILFYILIKCEASVKVHVEPRNVHFETTLRPILKKITVKSEDEENAIKDASALIENARKNATALIMRENTVT